MRVCIIAALMVPAACAADAFYLGTWKIASAVVAPWADPAVRKRDAAEMRGLVGKSVIIGAHAIQGPRAVACRNPHFQVKDYAADMLFQGAFGEMHEQNRSADPVKIAAGLGFRNGPWKTLETGCGDEIDYHFIDSSTAAFGLNDYVYVLKKIR